MTSDDRFSEPRDGFADIRWTASPASVAARFPSDRLRELPTYEGRNPRTGERVSIGPGFTIDHFPHPRLSTMITFDPDSGGVRGFTIALMHEDRHVWTEADWDAFEAFVAATIRELAERLRLGEVSTELPEQTWSVDGVEIAMSIDTFNPNFTLFIRRPQ